MAQATLESPGSTRTPGVARFQRSSLERYAGLPALGGVLREVMTVHERFAIDPSTPEVEREQNRVWQVGVHRNCRNQT